MYKSRHTFPVRLFESDVGWIEIKENDVVTVLKVISSQSIDKPRLTFFIDEDVKRLVDWMFPEFVVLCGSHAVRVGLLRFIKSMTKA